MKKKIPVVAVKGREERAAHLGGLSAEAQVALGELAGALKDGLLSFTTTAGMLVMWQLMVAEMTELIGPKHAKQPGRAGNWHGTTKGSVVLGGRTVQTERPRGRTVDGTEISLDSWELFSSRDLLTQVTLERMLAGVATRRHGDVADPLGSTLDRKSRSMSKSAVSARFVRATGDKVKELMARRLDELDVAVLMIDGIEVAGSCVVVAMVITGDGTKIPVGLWQGDTENKTVVTALLADLVARGLRHEHGILVVIDGAKALAAGVAKVFGRTAAVQRCIEHKTRNVEEHLAREQRPALRRRLKKYFANPDPVAGLAAAKALAGELDKAGQTGAAASLREGLEDMFTVTRLGVTGTLAATLRSTNPIESMISIARTVSGRVKNWQDPKMIGRWTVAGMLEAERSFRRVKGYRQLRALTENLAKNHGVDTEIVTPDLYTQAA